MILKVGRLFIIKKEVCLMVHLFFCYQVLAQIQPTSKIYGTLESKYFEALHYQSDSWPLLSIDTLATSDKANGYYINAFSACLFQFFENRIVAEDATQKAINYLEKGSKNANNSYYLAELYLMRSLLLASQGQNINAFLAFRSAYKQSENNLKSYPNDINIKKTDALIQTLLGSVPNQFQWVLSIFGFSGDYEAGINQLSKIAGSNANVSLESELIVLLLEQYIQNKSGLARLIELHKAYPQSQTIRLILNASALKNNQSALIIADRFVPKIPLILLQMGEAHLNSLKPELAIPFYENYESKSKKLMTAADQYKWWSAYILIGNDRKAEELRNRILNNKSILTEADQYAQFDAKKNKVELSLLKIRLATDGGFFNLAEQQIRIAENTLAPTDENRAELAYRIGRLAQLKSENGKAISSFKKVLEFNINPLPYYIPNTAFQLGEIFKTQSQLDSAHIFYKKCLQYKDYPYESSIKKKASLRLKEAGK
jgi:hypothetical protein